jgi:hypothetical protein
VQIALWDKFQKILLSKSQQTFFGIYRNRAKRFSCKHLKTSQILAWGKEMALLAM